MDAPPLPPPPPRRPDDATTRVPMPSGLRAALVIGIVGGVIIVGLVIWLVVVIVTNPTY